MKKLLFLMVFCILSVMTCYADPVYLCVYTTSDGDTPRMIPAENLMLTIVGDKLVATNEVEGGWTFPLDELKGMEFSTDSTVGISDILENNSGIIKLYDINGVCAGEFNSFEEANKGLSKGLYVIKSENNTTVKILLGK